MKNFTHLRLLLPVVSVLGVSSIEAQADLKWTETFRFGNKKSMPTSSTTKWMNNKAQRTITKMEMGPMKMNTHELAICGTNKQFVIDDDLKLYAETSFDPTGLGMPNLPSMNPAGGFSRPKAPSGPKKTGTVEISYKISQLGTEKIAGVNSRHYVMESTITSTGCAGKGTQKMKMELWQANIAMPAPCFKPNVEDAVKAMRKLSSESNCEIKTIIKTPPSAFKNISSGMTMRMKFGQGDSQFIKEVTSLSQAKIPTSQFALPAGYKKVSEAELNKARSNAMMKKMMGGLPKMN
jgi:hypothetical protein